jgi:hypothetical protein
MCKAAFFQTNSAHLLTLIRSSLPHTTLPPHGCLELFSILSLSTPSFSWISLKDWGSPVYHYNSGLNITAASGRGTPRTGPNCPLLLHERRRHQVLNRAASSTYQPPDPWLQSSTVPTIPASARTGIDC